METLYGVNTRKFRPTLRTHFPKWGMIGNKNILLPFRWNLWQLNKGYIIVIRIIGMLYFPFIIHMPKRSYFSSHLQHRISYLLKAISLPFLLFFVLITIGIYFITGRYMMTGHLLMMGKCSWSIMHQMPWCQ